MIDEKCTRCGSDLTTGVAVVDDKLWCAWAFPEQHEFVFKDAPHVRRYSDWQAPQAYFEVVR